MKNEQIGWRRDGLEQRQLPEHFVRHLRRLVSTREASRHRVACLAAVQSVCLAPLSLLAPSASTAEVLLGLSRQRPGVLESLLHLKIRRRRRRHGGRELGLRRLRTLHAGLAPRDGRRLRPAERSLSPRDGVAYPLADMCGGHGDVRDGFWAEHRVVDVAAQFPQGLQRQLLRHKRHHLREEAVALSRAPQLRERQSSASQAQRQRGHRHLHGRQGLLQRQKLRHGRLPQSPLLDRPLRTPRRRAVLHLPQCGRALLVQEAVDPVAAATYLNGAVQLRRKALLSHTGLVEARGVVSDLAACATT
eukprot:scaffold447_cov307-Pinguiococcus_pyrenoidosus.AAC.51